MAILNINGTDYSKNVVVGSYQVNSQDVYNSWTDANGINHRQTIRQQVSGTFTMQFRNNTEYSEFISHMADSKNSAGWIPCYMFVNNLNRSKSCNMFFTYSPTLTRTHGGMVNGMKQFDVEVAER